MWTQNGRLWFNVFASDKSRLYHCGFDNQNQSYCTCPSFYYQKGTIDNLCKHLREHKHYRELVEPMKSHYIKSNLNVINELFYRPDRPEECGYPIGSLTNFFGSSRRNKSIVATQCVMNAGLELKRNILFLQTEGKDGYFQTDPWVHILNKRFQSAFSLEHWYFDVAGYYFDQPKNKAQEITSFSYDLEKYWVKEIENPDAKARVIAIRTDSLFTLHLLTGYPCEMKPSTGGKFGLNPNPSWILDSFWKTPLFKIIHENNIGAIVLDSVSTPLKGLFMGEQMKYPARTDAIAAILIPLDKICANRNVVGITVHHGTRDESRQEEEKAYGGSIVEFSHKFELCFYGGKSNHPKNVRTVVRKRHPALPEQRRKEVVEAGNQFIQVTDEGVFDYDK